jgi:vancomycin resistance protein YoaR
MRTWQCGAVRRPRTGSILGVGLPLVVVLVFFAAWAFDTSAAADGSLRNVELDGVDIGGRTDTEVAAAVADRAADFATTKVEIRTPEKTMESTAGELGLSIDQAATVAAVLDEGRTGTALLRPLAWAGSFATGLDVESTYAVRRDQLALVLAGLEGPDSRLPVEPTIVASPEAVRVEPGQPGLALDAEMVADELMAAARRGEDPLTIEVEPEETAPQISDAEAQEVADRATAITAQPFVVTVGPKSATFEVAELRSWIGAQATDEGFDIIFDGEAMNAALVDRIGSLGDAEPKDADFTLGPNGQVQIIPAVTGLSCCGDDAAGLIAQALRDGKTTLAIEPTVEEPELTTAEAEALGIKEPVGSTTEWNGQPQVKSFTTYHACCENRVINIHKMADYVKGTVILPGETFSMNEVVGQRTAEKGFVLAGAISEGQHVEEIGGGVSQFATTTFNAAFFAGLPFVEYQAHSEHFARYPRGREATMGFPAPDLKFKNDTPYGIMVWASYTETSITVTLYSTQHATAQQTGQSEGRTGAHCTTVTTERTITYPDGTTAQDTVRATYRDDGFTTCG